MVQFYKSKKTSTKAHKHRHPAKTELLKNLSINTHDHTGQGLILSTKPITVVKNALVGEIFDAKVEYKNNKVKIINASMFHKRHSERTRPFCQHYDDCGGCNMQHTSAKHGLEVKQTALQEYMHKQTGIPFEAWESPVLSDINYVESTNQIYEFGYRRRIRLAVDGRQKNNVRIGFREEKSKDIIAISQCAIASSSIQAVLPNLLDSLKRLPAISNVGHIVLTDTGTQVYCGLYCTAKLSDLCLELLHKCIERISKLEITVSLALVIYQNYQAIALLNCDSEYFTMQDHTGSLIETNSSQFLQVNAGINDKMLKQAKTWLGLDETPVQTTSNSNSLYDFFCGSGNFTLFLANKFDHVYGFEGTAEMVEHARTNAFKNKIANAAFTHCNLDDDDALAKLTLEKACTVVLDPSRSGALKLCEKLVSEDVGHILYVSCNANSLIRDLNVLKPKYQVEKISVLDMFPFTKHLELMVLLTSKQVTSKQATKP
ncbi:23S rRNA (uracil(1939)-C(5))-methyltransferase RlmD [Glaciecola petra]|uniref:23S rRNA (Uracil(1939)-C(5))-methyltransferase RlmD n=1 Tax=Glaciecola petra TaxID=3075602 RepID=A0ABU2ZYS7_9ALTE|nr:23S rRNA (uracil(1939)-C(5))-methyltransferase RlmD [Aestuariibacter sp. P117]MDT0596587.1 23S rRNA (uracil(1939)-C(5))-methyltransferase RlmD [Aestuariibacter sp. P117]